MPEWRSQFPLQFEKRIVPARKSAQPPCHLGPRIVPCFFVQSAKLKYAVQTAFGLPEIVLQGQDVAPNHRRFGYRLPHQ